LLIALAFSLLFQFRHQSRQVRYLLCFSLLGLIGFFLMSFKKSINPNWPAVFYPAAMILLAAWGRNVISSGRLDGLRRLFNPAWKFGAFLLVIGYCLPFATQTVFDMGRKDPSWRIRGWQNTGKVSGEILKQQPRPEETFILGLERKHSAEAAFYMQGNPRTYHWPGDPPLVGSQYEVWSPPLDKFGWDALILADGGQPLPTDMAKHFDRLVPLGTREIEAGGNLRRKMDYYRGENLHSWPQKR
jgi:hypothetical protein